MNRLALFNVVAYIFLFLYVFVFKGHNFSISFKWSLNHLSIFLIAAYPADLAADPADPADSAAYPAAYPADLAAYPADPAAYPADPAAYPADPADPAADLFLAVSCAKTALAASIASLGRLSSGYSFSNSFKHSSALKIPKATESFLVHLYALIIRISEYADLSFSSWCSPLTSTFARTSPCT